MGNGPLGGNTNPGISDGGTLARMLNLPPGTLSFSMPSWAEVENRARHAAHKLVNAVSTTDTSTAIGQLLGQQSFTAGIVYGMCANLAGSVWQLAKLFKTLALAEYWDTKHAGTFWERAAHSFSFGPMGPSMMDGLSAVASFWPGLDDQARRAHDDREALKQLVIYSFEHPGEVFGKIGATEKRKYEEFKAFLARHTMSGDFHAGALFGELLFDILLLIDGVTAIAKIAAKIPGLLRLLPELEELAPALRAALRKPEVPKAGEFAEGPKPQAVEAKPSAAGDAAADAAPAKPDPTKMTTSEKGVYGEAMSDQYMDGKGFEKMNGDLVQVGDKPLGQGIDGVWKNGSPPPEYVITESKYGTSQLSTLKDGTKQMSDKWVSDRLDNAVGEEAADDIRYASSRGQVEKWLLQVDSSGNVTKSIIPPG
ncbi:MAG: hypothetical protein ACTHL8_23760 [Burkholderiaceae bacterium]